MCALGFLALTGVPAGATTTADPVVTNFNSTIRVERDGTLKVVEVWKLSNVTGTFTRFVVTREHLPDDVDHVQKIEDLQVKSGGAEKTKELPVTKIDFVPPLIETGRPDFALIQSTVDQALVLTTPSPTP